MREFIVKAHAAPTQPELFLKSVNTGARVEFLAQCVLAGLFTSQGHREDCRLHLVLESSKDMPRVLTLDGSRLGSLPGLDEGSILLALADALKAGAKLVKGASTVSEAGIEVRALSFEAMVKASAERPMFLLDPRGADVRATEMAPNAVVFLTDHVPMNRNTLKFVKRLGAAPLSLGPRMLHASACLTLLHGEWDRLG